VNKLTKKQAKLNIDPQVYIATNVEESRAKGVPINAEEFVIVPRKDCILLVPKPKQIKEDK